MDILKILLVVSFIYFVFLLIWLVGIGSFAMNKSKYSTTDLTIGEQHQLFILVPALNEKSVIAETIKAELAALKRLPAKVQSHLVIIDDASDDGTTALLKQLHDPMLEVIYRQRPNARQGKGLALNYAFQSIQRRFKTNANTIYGVLDADAFMDTEDIESVIHNFEIRDVQLIQTGVGMSNADDNWLTKAQNFEFYANNSLIQTVRNLTGTAISSGNGQFMKQVYLDNVSWGNSLLEDCEFTIRGFLKGYHTFYLRTAIVYQQAIDHLIPLMRQRTRWCQGSLQCLKKYTRSIFKSQEINSLQKFDIDCILWVPIMGVIFIISNMIALLTQLKLTLIYHYYIVFIILVLIVFGFWAYMFLVYRNNDHREHSTLAMIAFLVLNFILAVIPFRAIFRELLNRNNWVKTDHSGHYNPVVVKRNNSDS